MLKIIRYAIMFSFMCAPVFALNEIEEGVWMSDIKQNGNNISYTMKIASNSGLWTSYASQKGMLTTDFAYALMNYNIDCNNSKFNISASLIDENGHIKERVNLTDTNNKDTADLKQNLAILCSSYVSNK